MSEEKPKPKNRVLFRLFKGFIYGNVVGLIFGIAIFLLASAVNMVATALAQSLPVTPVVLMLLIYAASVVSGTAVEYSHWLEEQG